MSSYSLHTSGTHSVTFTKEGVYISRLPAEPWNIAWSSLMESIRRDQTPALTAISFFAALGLGNQLATGNQTVAYIVFAAIILGDLLFRLIQAVTYLAGTTRTVWVPVKTFEDVQTMLEIFTYLQKNPKDNPGLYRMMRKHTRGLRHTVPVATFKKVVYGNGRHPVHSKPASTLREASS